MLTFTIYPLFKDNLRMKTITQKYLKLEDCDEILQSQDTYYLSYRTIFLIYFIIRHFSAYSKVAEINS